MIDESRLRSAVERTARPFLAAAGAPGAVVALSIDGHPVAVPVGFADRDETTPLSADAAFYLYSITKTLVAVAALRLAEEGRLDLDAPLRDAAPRPGYEGGVSLRRLLDHTGGIPDYGGMAAYHAAVRANPDAPWTAGEFLDRTLDRGPLFPPGGGWAYSNVGFLLVRLAVERACGAPLRDVLARLVFAPLGLRRTRVAESLADAGDLTPGCGDALDEPGDFRDVSRRYHPGWVSHGVVVSTAPETARILDAIADGTLLGGESLAAMLDPVDVPGDHPPFARAAYGLGAMIDRQSPYGTAFGHAGSGPGYSTAAFHFPDVAGRRLTAVALVNADAQAVALPLAFALAEAVAGLAAPPPSG